MKQFLRGVRLISVSFILHGRYLRKDSYDNCIGGIMFWMSLNGKGNPDIV